MAISLEDLYKVAERHDILVECVALHNEGAFTLEINGDEYAIFVDNNRNYDEATRKMMLAHELGHCATGSFYNEKTPVFTRGKCERRANEWAIEELITRDKFRRALRSGYHEPRELAEYFNVPESLIHKAFEYYRTRI